MKQFLGNYVGIVIQNNDPEYAGKVKVFVPHVSASVYSKWVNNKTNKRFKFLGSNLDTLIKQNINSNNNEGLTQIVEELKIVLPWAHCAAPLVSENAGGRYNNFNDFANISDSNYYSTFSQSTTGAGETPGKPGFFYENPDNRLSDAFVNASDNINRPNPLAFEYIPSTYSNRAKGAFGVPSVGSHVWVFFREGNPTLPVYFAASYGSTDWKGIYEAYDNPGIDYPGAFENKSKANTAYDVNVETYRNKYVINQKGGSIEINNTDLKEKLKFTHYSGSFKEFNNQANIELAVGNDQKLVLNDSYETVRGFKNEFVGKGKDEIITRDNYRKVGSLNEEYFQKWKDTYAPVQDNKQLFEIQRAVASNVTDTNNNIVIKRNSLLQQRSGTFAPHPALNQTYYSLNDDSSGLPAFINSILSNVASSIMDGSSMFSQLAIPAQKASFPSLADYTLESKIKWHGIPGLSPSSQDGKWVPETQKDKIKELTQSILPTLTDIEKNIGIGGSEIVQITKHKVETIGMVVNDYGSIRFDNVGKMVPRELLINNLGTYINFEPSPLIELTHVQDLPGGNYTLNVCNRYNVMVGAGGLNLKSIGPTNITGTVTNIAGEQVNISSENEININSKTVNISAEILRIRNTKQKQIFIENSLGVNNNVVVGGALSVDGEMYVQHVTAPAEYQVTQSTTAFGEVLPGALLTGVTYIGPINHKLSPKEQAIAAAHLAIPGMTAGLAQTLTVVDGFIQGFIVAPSVTVVTAASPDSIAVSEHSHIFRNLPLTLHDKNSDVRADSKEINNNTGRVIAQRRAHGVK